MNTEEASQETVLPKSRWAEFREKYRGYDALLFFIVGFLFDVFTLRRIDDWLKIFFQILFIVLLALFLVRDFRWSQEKWEPFGVLKKIWKYETEIVHFLFGSLLSAFVIFYFKSASLSHSLLFMAFLAILMVMNESDKFREQGLTLRICLLNFCLSSFLIYFLPLLLGFMGEILFIISLIVSNLIFSGFIYTLYKVSLDKPTYMKKMFPKHVLPAAAVTLFLLGSYFLKIIPPVPLSMNFGGIYHNVEKEEGHIKLYSMKPWYNFWSHGDSTFLARPDDKLFCFVRVFAPAKFSHKIYLHWALFNPRSHNYETQDRIEMPIIGGREEGFRSYSYKTHYQPGDWRVDVETEDQRVIGTIDFTVEPDQTTGDRIWMVDEG